MSSGDIQLWTMIAATVSAFATVAYTVLTVVLCRANMKSANAANNQSQMMQAQTEELLRQYREANRARISLRYGYDKATGKYVIIKNVGRKDASNVRFSIDESFMSELDKVFDKNHLRTLAKSTLHVAPGQEFPIFITFSSKLHNMAVTVAKFQFTYSDEWGTYCESANVDLSQYGFISHCVNTKIVDGHRTEEVLEVKG